MATVIGIFENQYLNKKPLTVVKPGDQTRRFTHINDTVQVCFEAFKKISVNITALAIKTHIQFYKLQICLNQKLYF